MNRQCASKRCQPDIHHAYQLHVRVQHDGTAITRYEVTRHSDIICTNATYYAILQPLMLMNLISARYTKRIGINNNGADCFSRLNASSSRCNRNRSDGRYMRRFGTDHCYIQLSRRI